MRPYCSDTRRDVDELKADLMSHRVIGGKVGELYEDVDVPLKVDHIGIRFHGAEIENPFDDLLSIRGSKPRSRK